MVVGSMKRKSLDISEFKVKDPRFEKEINSIDSPIHIKTTYLTNSERLVGNAKQFFELLRKNKLISNNGIILFDTTSNLNIKNRVNLKKNLQTCIMEDCFLEILSHPENIRDIEAMVEEVEQAYKLQLDDGIEAFANNGTTYKCDQSNLELYLSCSSYSSTYGDMSNYSKNNSAEKPVQIELKYCFDNFKGLNKSFLDEIQYCRVRFEAPRFINYLKYYALDYLNRIKKAQQHKKIKINNEQIYNENEYNSYLDDIFPNVSDIEVSSEETEEDKTELKEDSIKTRSKK